MPRDFDDDWRIRDDLPRRSSRRDDDDRPRRRRRGLYRPTQEERSSASMCHLLGMFLGFLGPLIIWATRKEESRFVDHHGREALNLGVNLLIWNLILTAIITVIAIVTCGFGGLLFPLMFIPVVYGIVMGIQGMNAANRGEWLRFSGMMRIISPVEGMEDAPPRRRFVEDDRPPPRDWDEPAPRFDAEEAHGYPDEIIVREPAPRGTSLWVWLVGGGTVLLLGGCCLGGGILAVYEARKSRRPVARFSTKPAGPAGGQVVDADAIKAGRVDPAPNNNGRPAPPRPADPPKPALPNDPVDRALVQMKSGDQFERGRAADSLVHIKADSHPKRAEVVMALDGLLRGADQIPRQAAARALVVWAAPSDVDVLLELLKQSFFTEKRTVLDKLGKSKDPRAIKAVVAAVKEPSVRQNAVEAAKAIGPPAEDEVVPLLQDRSPTVKRAACDILKAIGTKKSLPALEALSKERSAITAGGARDAIAAIKARHP